MDVSYIIGFVLIIWVGGKESFSTDRARIAQALSGTLDIGSFAFFYYKTGLCRNGENDIRNDCINIINAIDGECQVTRRSRNQFWKTFVAFLMILYLRSEEFFFFLYSENRSFICLGILTSGFLFLLFSLSLCQLVS